MELFQGINDPVKKKCPECGKNKLQRQFGTGAAIVFKGSGFYQTDYRSDGYKKAAEADKKAKSDSSSDTGSSDKSSASAKSDSSSSAGSSGSSPDSASSSKQSSD